MKNGSAEGKKIGYYKKTEPNHLNNELDKEIFFTPTKIPIWELFKRVRNQNNNTYSNAPTKDFTNDVMKKYNKLLIVVIAMVFQMAISNYCIKCI